MLILNRCLLVTGFALVCLAAAPCALAQKGTKGGGAGPAAGGASAGSHPTSGPVFGSPSDGGLIRNGGANYDPFSPYGGRVYDPSFGTLRTMTPQEERLQRAMQKQRNLDRRKAMLSDSDRLVQLANSIQHDVQSADGKLAHDAEKRANEVEKLAKSVQRKMAGDN